MPPEAAQIQDDAQLDPAVIAADAGGQSDAGNDDEPQSSEEAVKVASLMGWKPKSEWRGDQTKWRPAEDFLADVPEVLKHTRQANGQLKAKLDQVAGMVAKLDANQRRQTDAQLDAELDAAIEDGDNTRIKAARDAIRSAASEPKGGNGAVESFRERNSAWFDVDPEATAYAAALDAQYARLSGGITDPDAHMKRIEAGVKKKFPEHFGEVEGKPEPQAQRQQTRAPLVGSGGRVGGRASNAEVTAANLTPAQRASADKMEVDYASFAKAVNKINRMAAQ